MKAQILLVEDDPNLGNVMLDLLTDKGYTVTRCMDGEEGKKVFEKNKFDICLLDVMMPRIDGYTLAQAIRKINPEVPILFVTARSMMEDKMEGFQVGGDDYIVKPFHMDELVARIEVFLKRRSSTGSSLFTIGQYRFDYSNVLLSHPLGEVSLTQKEADVLKYLVQNNDRVVRREDLLNQVWGSDDYFMGRSLDVYITKLRKYLVHDASLKISNHHGIGFKLESKA